MIKVVLPSSFNFDQQVMSVIDVHSKGVDSCWLKKSAAVLTKELSEVRPDPNFTHVHLIALGDQEKTGFNRNGDGFPKATNKTRHDTFVKYANWFHNHRNKPARGDKIYGHVKASAYNEPMGRVELIVAIDNKKDPDSIEKLARGEDIPVSMACFPPGTLVRLSSGDERPIEDVKVGDKVITHTGRVCPVTVLMSRQFTEDLVTFKAAGAPDTLRLTPNHRVWVRPSLKGKMQFCPVCSNQFKSLNAHLWQSNDAQHKLAYKDYSRYAEGWVPAEQLATGDFVRTPFNRSVTEEGCARLATVLGYYLSEGNTFDYKRNTDRDYNKGVDFSFGGSEQHLVDRLSDQLRSLGYDNIHVYRRKNNVLLVRVHSVKLHDDMIRLGGRYSWGKRIAAEVMTWDPKTQLCILNAYIDGDGCFNKAYKNLAMVTVSRNLAWQLGELCWRNEVPARIDADKTVRPNKRRAYTVAVQGQHVDKFNTVKLPDWYKYEPVVDRNIGHLNHQEPGTMVARKVAVAQAYVEKGFVYRRITKVGRDTYTGTVHNLTVADDHSYVVSGVAVSNCKEDFDECSICHHKAKTEIEHCKHIKEACAQMTEDGQFVGMINPPEANITFFDISKVHRNADRIAFSLRKVASHGQVTLSTDLAKFYGITEPASMVKDASFHRFWQLLQKVAKLEKEITGEIKANPSMQMVADGLNEPVKTELKIPDDKLPAALGKLASDRVSLAMPDFFRLVLGPRFSEVEADLPAAQAYLPTVFSGAEKNAEDFLSGIGNYVAVDMPLPVLIKNTLSKVGQQVSLLGALQTKVAAFTLRKEATLFVPNKSLQETTEIGRILATEYARYKLAMLDKVEDPFVAKLAVLQNFGS
jgi:hypothetical protein